MSTSPAIVAMTTFIDALEASWKRSALAALPQGVEVPDRLGHGFDEICPVTQYGIVFSLGESDHIAPFSESQITTPGLGVGYISVKIEAAGGVEYESFGCPPVLDFPFEAIFSIRTPQDGPRTAFEYAGALNSIFRNRCIHVAHDFVLRLENREPPEEIPEDMGVDGIYDVYQHSIMMHMIYIGPTAETA